MAVVVVVVVVEVGEGWVGIRARGRAIVRIWMPWGG
jgi:hypothetical protein